MMQDEITEVELDVIDKITNEATPGPWHVGTCHTGEECWCRTVFNPRLIHESTKDQVSVVADGAAGRENAEFIAMSRQAIPKLVKIARDYLLLRNIINR